VIYDAALHLGVAKRWARVAAQPLKAQSIERPTLIQRRKGPLTVGAPV